MPARLTNTIYVATLYVPVPGWPRSFSANQSFSGTLPQVVAWADSVALDAHKYGSVYNSIVRFGTYCRSCAGRAGGKYLLVILPQTF